MRRVVLLMVGAVAGMLLYLPMARAGTYVYPDPHPDPALSRPAHGPVSRNRNAVAGAGVDGRAADVVVEMESPGENEAGKPRRISR